VSESEIIGPTDELSPLRKKHNISNCNVVIKKYIIGLPKLIKAVHCQHSLGNISTKYLKLLYYVKI